MTIRRHPLPDGWRWTTLAEVGRWSSGGTPKSSIDRYYEGEHPWAIIGDLTDGPVASTERTITADGLAESSAKLVPPGTLLVAMYGSIGKLGISQTQMATNQAIACCRPVADVEVKWLFFWLLSCRDALTAAGKGGTQSNISQTVLKSWPVPVPPPAEQRATVETIERMLSHLDAAREEVGRVERRVALAHQAIIEQALKQASSAPRVPLGDLATIFRNGGHWREPSLKPPGHPIFRISAVRPGQLRVEERGYVSSGVSDEEIEKFAVREGSLLFTRYNGNPNLVGACAHAPPEAVGVLHPDKLIRVDLDERCLPEWVVLAAAGGVTRRHIDLHVKTTSGQTGIAGRDLKLAPVPVPSRAEQQALVDQAKDARNRLDRLARTGRLCDVRAGVLRRSILKAAFEGRLTSASAAPSGEDLQEKIA